MLQTRVILAYLDKQASDRPDGDFFSELALQHTHPHISTIHKGIRDTNQREFNEISDLVDLAVSDPDAFVHKAKFELLIPKANKVAVLACQRRPELWALFLKNRLLRKREAREAFEWLFKSEPHIDDDIKEQHINYALRSNIIDQNALISMGLITND